MTKNLIPLLHEPLVPPRDGIIGEHVYSTTWKRLMVIAPATWDDSTMLDVILTQYGSPVGQREASVCASVICWLGTNCGSSFLNSCNKLVTENVFHDRADAYLAAWAIFNKRRKSINSGVRTIEHCLSTSSVSPRHEASGQMRPALDLTADDYECIECLIQWLGGTEGQKFIAYCEIESKLQRDRPTFPFKDMIQMGGE